MKTFNDYINDKHTKLFEETGTFFAFSSEQFKEKSKPGVKYADCGSGMICPKENVDKLLEGLKQARIEAVQEDLEENGKEAIIKRELMNHECFYTNDVEDAMRILKLYDCTLEEVKKTFYEEKENLDPDYY